MQRAHAHKCHHAPPPLLLRTQRQLARCKCHAVTRRAVQRRRAQRRHGLLILARLLLPPRPQQRPLPRLALRVARRSWLLLLLLLLRQWWLLLLLLLLWLLLFTTGASAWLRQISGAAACAGWRCCSSDALRISWGRCLGAAILLRLLRALLLLAAGGSGGPLRRGRLRQRDHE